MKELASGYRSCLLSFCAIGASGPEETGRVELLPIIHRRNPLFQLRCAGREGDDVHLDFLQPRVLCVKLFFRIDCELVGLWRAFLSIFAARGVGPSVSSPLLYV